MTGPKDQKTLAQIVERLAHKYPALDQGTIIRTVENAYHSLSGSPIRDFVPVLVERAASEQLARR